MSTLETVGWLSGIMIAIIGILSWAIEDIPQEIRITIGVISVIILASSGIWHRKQETKKPTMSETDQSSFPILSEYREKYHDHIEDLFKEVKKNLSPVIKPPDYFTALQKTKEKKRMILQHLYTLDSLSDMYSNMFTMYKISIATFNEAEKNKKQILRDVEDFDEKLDSYDFGHHEGECIDIVDFKKAVGIKRNDSTEDFFKNKLLYEFPSSINCNFYIRPDNDEFKLGFAGHWFARSKNKIKLEEFKDFIYKNGYDIMQEVSSIHSKIGTVYKVGVPIFNQEFKEHDEALEGEPILGACTTCLKPWFNNENIKKYQPLLDQFNSIPSNYYEELWSNDKNLD
jgi:hypothetical protein